MVRITSHCSSWSRQPAPFFYPGPLPQPSLPTMRLLCATQIMENRMIDMQASYALAGAWVGLVWAGASIYGEVWPSSQLFSVRVLLTFWVMQRCCSYTCCVLAPGCVDLRCDSYARCYYVQCRPHHRTRTHSARVVDGSSLVLVCAALTILCTPAGCRSATTSCTTGPWELCRPLAKRMLTRQRRLSFVQYT